MADTTKPIDPGSARATIFDPDAMTEPMEAIVRIGSLTIPARFDPDASSKLACAQQGLTFIPSEPSPAITAQALPTLDTFIHNPSGLGASRNFEDEDSGMGGTHGQTLAPADWPKVREVSRRWFDRSFDPIALDPKAARDLLEDYEAGPAAGVLTVGPGDTDYDALRQTIEGAMRDGAKKIVFDLSSPGGSAAELISAYDSLRLRQSGAGIGSIGIVVPWDAHCRKYARISLTSLTSESEVTQINQWAQTSDGPWARVHSVLPARRAHPRSMSRIKRQRKEGRR